MSRALAGDINLLREKIVVGWHCEAVRRDHDLFVLFVEIYLQRCSQRASVIESNFNRIREDQFEASYAMLNVKFFDSPMITVMSFVDSSNFVATLSLGLCKLTASKNIGAQ